MARRGPRQRLRDILDAVERIERYSEAKSFKDYAADAFLRDAVERNIERISEASRHIPKELTDKFGDIPWREISDIGNVLRHGYDDVDDRIMWGVVTDDLAALKVAVERMIDEIDPKRMD